MSDDLKPSLVPSIFRANVVIRPRDDTMLSLAEALTWIAFSASVTADTLLLAFCFADPRLVYPARARLVRAVDRLAYHASRGAISVNGWYKSIGDEPDEGFCAPEISTGFFRKFTRYDAFIDGLRPGRGLAWQHSSEGMDTALVDPPGPAHHRVEVEQAQLLALFPNGHGWTTTQPFGPSKPRGRPKGSGSLEKADQPFLTEMLELLATNEAKSPNDAARLVAPKAPGYGDLDSKQKRLVRNFMKRQAKK
jgi:hypothetical protein